MITYDQGSLFTSSAQALVNTVNTVGVMGKGIALSFKIQYPDMFQAYKAACADGKVRIGSLWLWNAPARLIVNFPTKKHWRNPSQLPWIEDGLKAFVNLYEAAGITSVAFPPLGCGNGGLDFLTQVQPLMEQYLAPLPIAVTIYGPSPKISLSDL